jgi:uncharacterized iron-regulated protein
MIEGHARIIVPEKTVTSIQTADLNIKRTVLNKKEYLSLEDFMDAVENGHGKRIIEIDYTADFPPAEPVLNMGNSGVLSGNVIDDSGVLLLSHWYPDTSTPSLFQLTAALPPSFSAVSEFEDQKATFHGEFKRVAFESLHPLPSITLIAGPYHVFEDEFYGVRIKTLLLADEPGLASDYITETKKYINLYERLLGGFPYREFAIVENPNETTHSFPTYALLGPKVIRLPFIAKTVLGHEILQQWFGNYVYRADDEGSWVEGLTTYLFDQCRPSVQEEVAEHRKKILLDYRNTVSSENEISLGNVQWGEDPATKAVGRGKGAMVFHMLRKKIGDDAFFTGLKHFTETHKFRKASWTDVKDTFSALSSDDLDPFFDHWINSKGIVSLDLEDPVITFRDGAYVLSFGITQPEPHFHFPLPLRVTSKGATENFTIPMDSNTVHFERPFTERPEEVVIDDHYDVMRELTAQEVPPIIQAFTGNKQNVVIVPKDKEALYRNAAEFFKTQGYTVESDHEIKNELLSSRSLLILSKHNRVYKRLFAGKPLPQGGLVVQVEKNPLNVEHAAVIMDGRSPDDIDLLYKEIFRYGNYSKLIFEGGRFVTGDIAPSAQGIVKPLDLVAEAVETKKVSGLDAVFAKIRNYPVLFVGEAHTAYAHHLMQLEIIRRLYHDKGKLMIGMEMFQRPFQEHLDRYIEGAISEEAFLRESEYFTRWKYDYNLYRDILHFARAHQIPVFALNLKEEITRKVARDGINALTEEEYALIPQEMDLTNQEYRDSMKAVLEQHGNSKNSHMIFENFFQSQILWDETMAHSVNEAISNNPDTQMVVLAGNGHLQYSWGIPDRVKRLSGLDVAVILNDVTEGITSDLADYLLFPAPVETPESPKLMVSLRPEETGLVVNSVLPHGPADNAGILEGDLLIELDDQPVEIISDVKLALLNKRHGQTIKAKVKRREFIFLWKELDVDVDL